MQMRSGNENGGDRHRFLNELGRNQTLQIPQILVLIPFCESEKKEKINEFQQIQLFHNFFRSDKN